MHIYGLTGGIASGKTTVSKHLEQLGCPIIDADIISRQVVSPHQPAWKAIIGAFGVDVLNNDGTLNRSKLGDLIFHDENQRKLLNIITHPYIQRAMIWQILKHFLKGMYDLDDKCHNIGNAS
jgi:dephospho-CoA kinase